MKKNSVTIRRSSPEGTAYTTIIENGKDAPIKMIVSVGKAGTEVNAYGDGLARAVAAALRAGADPCEMGESLAGLSHHRSGQHEAQSVADAVGQSLLEWDEENGDG